MILEDLFEQKKKLFEQNKKKKIKKFNFDS